DRRGERPAVEELHHEEHGLARGADEVRDLHDVRVSESRCGEGLAMEPLDRALVERLGEDLHRDAAAEVLLNRLVDEPHRAGVEAPEDPVTTVELPSEETVRHATRA